MRSLPLLFLILLLATGARASEPLMAESKVSLDLEAALSRMIPREQFLVQVSADIGHSTERKLVEGETFRVTPDRPESAPPMPGFTLEDSDDPIPPPPQERQVYRMVEHAELTLVRVHVGFDEAIDPQLVHRAKIAVRDYLALNFAGKSALSFSTLPMRATRPANAVMPPPPEKEKEHPWMKYLPWGVAGLFALLAFGLLLGRNAPTLVSLKSPRGPREPAPAKRPTPELPARAGAGARGVASEERAAEERRELLHRFLSRSGAFRFYFDQLAPEGKADVCSAMQGAAFDNLMDGLGLRAPRATEASGNPEDVIARHAKDFDEFVEAKEWHDRQFFGFLHHLSGEQVLALFRRENPLAACIMLRFLRPTQSASVLEQLPPGRRMEILQQIPQVERTGIHQMATIEREMRTLVQEMPTHAFGSKREDLEFWGTVLGEANDQESILRDLEQTNPEIYPNLKKFRFRLEDAAALPNNLLEKVFREIDNDELAAALASCKPDVVDVLLDAVGPKRRNYLTNQLESMRGAPEAETRAARQTVTRRIREVMT